MTYDEFTQKIKLLEDFYDKEYNLAQKQIMFDELKYYDADKCERAIRAICKVSRYKPTLSEILEAMRRTPTYNVERETHECKLCHGTGYVIYHKTVDGRDYEYACLCNCKNAEGREYDGTKIADKEHRSNYYLEKAENVFLGGEVK